MQKRRRIKQTASLEERLTGLARKAREDVELLPAGRARDALLQKIREIEAATLFNQFLRTPTPR